MKNDCRVCPVYVVIPAAGNGSRLGLGMNKVFAELEGQPLLVHTLRSFQTCPQLAGIQLVGHKNELKDLEALCHKYEIGHVFPPVEGGASRQASVFAGLQALKKQAAADGSIVLVHDASRCLVTAALIQNCVTALQQRTACIAAVAVKDTIKIIDPDGRVKETPPRSALWQVQTPQGFRLSDLYAAHEWAVRNEYEATDDAALLEHLGVPVYVVPGDYSNIKITTQEDLSWAELFLQNNNRGGETG